MPPGRERSITLTSVLDKDSKFSIANKMQGRFLGLVGVSDQATDHIDHEVGEAAVTGVFNLRDIFQLVNDGFDDGTLPLPEFVSHVHQAVFHVGFELGDELDTLFPKLFE